VSRTICLAGALCLALSLASVGAATPILPDGPPPSPPLQPAPAAPDGAADEDVRAAERTVETLDEDPVLITRETCSDEAHFARRCRDFQYDVEQERARARNRLETAREKLAAIEEASRIAGVPMVCLDDPAE